MTSCHNRLTFALASTTILSLAACTGPQSKMAQRAYAPDRRPLQSVQFPAEVVRSTNDQARLEEVAEFSGPMPTGIAVSSDNRIFLSFPRWGDPVRLTVGELRDNQLIPYPNPEINSFNLLNARDSLVSVQSVVADSQNRLWLVDSGNINMAPNLANGPKLVAVDLATNRVIQTIHFPTDVVRPDSYINDVRIDLRHQNGPNLPGAGGARGYAYLSDSSSKGDNGIIVVDLASGQSWRKLDRHPSVLPDPGLTPMVEGDRLMVRQPLRPEKPLTMGSDGIALSPDGQRLFYRPLVSHHLYSIDTALLIDPAIPADRVAAGVRDHGDLGFASDGILCDSHGALYLTDYEHHAVHVGDPSTNHFDVLVSDPRLIWPDTLAIGPDQYLYITANQLDRQPRFHAGADLRKPPYALFRTRISAGPSFVQERP